MQAQVRHYRGALRRERSSAAPSWRTAKGALGYLLFWGVVCLAYVFIPARLQNLTQVAAGVSAVGAIMLGVRRRRPANAKPWYAMALGLLLLTTGDGIWTYYEEVLHRESPFPSVADVVYLIAYVPLAAGLVLVVRAKRPGRDTGSLVDAAVLTTAAAVATWVFLMEPQTHDPMLSRWGFIVSLAYPLVDVLLLATAASVTFGANVRAFAFRLIGASLASLIIADTLYTLGTINEWYETGSPVDIFWIASYALWGAAALHPTMKDVTTPGDEQEMRFTRRRLAMQALAVMAIPMMRVVQAIRHAPPQGTIIAVGAAIASLLVIFRMAGLLTAVESAALRDPLTGLPNRRLLLDRMSQAFRRAERTKAPVAVLFLDLGGFKTINDRFGHEGGDHALVEIGRRIEAAVRRSDTVARLGGDEFVIVCEGLDRFQAAALADRVRVEVALPLEIDTELVELTVDLGLAVEHVTAEGDVSQLLAAADRAMYQAKAAANQPR